MIIFTILMSGEDASTKSKKRSCVVVMFVAEMGDPSNNKLQVKTDRAVKYANHSLEPEQPKQPKVFVGGNT